MRRCFDVGRDDHLDASEVIELPTQMCRSWQKWDDPREECVLKVVMHMSQQFVKREEPSATPELVGELRVLYSISHSARLSPFSSFLESMT